MNKQIKLIQKTKLTAKVSNLEELVRKKKRWVWFLVKIIWFIEFYKKIKIIRFGGFGNCIKVKVYLYVIMGMMGIMGIKIKLMTHVKNKSKH